jgi:hypothetical protein
MTIERPNPAKVPEGRELLQYDFALYFLETISKFWIRPNNKADGDSKAEHTR